MLIGVGSALAMVVATAAVAAVPKAGKRWIRLDSEHFTFFSSATERTTRVLARDLEELRASLETLLPGLEIRSPVPTWIYVFEHRIEFARYRPIHDGKLSEVDGYFVAHPYGNFIALNGDWRTDPRRTVFHEYLHEIQRGNLPGLPLWFSEGMAELFASFQVLPGGTGVVGVPFRPHTIELRRPLLPLGELLSLEHEDRDYHRGAKRGMFYAQSWALVHYLMIGGPRQEATRDYLAALTAGGRGADQAYAAMIGDRDMLEAELRRYVRGRFTVAEVPVETGEDTSPGRMADLRHADVLHRLGDLLAHGSPEHAAAAREHFDAALAIDPAHAPSIAGLGFVTDRAGDLEAAVDRYRRAAETAPDDARLAYLYGQGLLRALGIDRVSPGTATAEQYRSILEARDVLARSTRLDPSFGEAWADLGFTYAVEAEPPPAAVRALLRAAELLPERLDVALNLFLVLTRRGDRPRAEALFEQVIAPAGDAMVIAQAEKGLLNLDIAEANALLDAGAYDALLPVLERILARADDPAVIAHAERQRAILTSMRARPGADRRRGASRPAPDDAGEPYRRAARLAAAGDLSAARDVLEALVRDLPDGDLRDEALDLLAVIDSQIDR